MSDRVQASAPDAPIDARRIEEAGLNAMQSQRQLFYDGWLLRISPGAAKRGRSVNPHFESHLPLHDKIEHCEALYARCGLPVLFRMTPFSRPSALEAVLLAHGYVAFDTTLVQTLVLDAPPEYPQDAQGARLHVVDAEGFADAAARLRGSSDTRRKAHRERLENSPLQSRLVTVEAAGELVCVAQMAAEGDVAGVFDVITAPQAQSRGYASLAVATLLAWAWEHAVRIAYLQVTASNAAGLAVYRKFGFATLYTYHYCGRPGALI